MPLWPHVIATQPLGGVIAPCANALTGRKQKPLLRPATAGIDPWFQFQLDHFAVHTIVRMILTTYSAPEIMVIVTITV